MRVSIVKKGKVKSTFISLCLLFEEYRVLLGVIMLAAIIRLNEVLGNSYKILKFLILVELCIVSR